MTTRQQVVMVAAHKIYNALVRSEGAPVEVGGYVLEVCDTYKLNVSNRAFGKLVKDCADKANEYAR